VAPGWLPLVHSVSERCLAAADGAGAAVTRVGGRKRQQHLVSGIFSDRKVP
jgi:hypothetical protein